MTRKDYQLVADAIRYSLPNGQVKADFVSYLLESMKRANDKLDEEKFEKACYQTEDTLEPEERL